jgi:deoxyribonuclease-4
MKMDKEYVYNKVKDGLRQIIDVLNKDSIKIWIRPETTGKESQWGNLDEVIRISKEFDTVLPCVDFSHLHARSGGQFNTYGEFSNVLERMGNEIGEYALKNFHAHIAGIEYGAKGEKKHLNLQESDMNYKDLLKALKAFDVKGSIVCESPNIEGDAVLLQNFYNTL